MDKPKRTKLPELIDIALAARRMTIRDLHRSIERMGIEVSYTAVHNWVSGKSQMGVGYAYYVVVILCLDPLPFLLAAALPGASTVSPKQSAPLPPARGPVEGCSSEGSP